MTHTLHRRGTKESLSKDYVLFCMAAKGLNEEGADEKMREFLRIVLKHQAINIGDMKTGNSLERSPDEIIEKVTSTSIVHGVFADLETVTKVMKVVKKANLGMSVSRERALCLHRGSLQQGGTHPAFRRLFSGDLGKDGETGASGDSGIYDHVRPCHDFRKSGGGCRSSASRPGRPPSRKARSRSARYAAAASSTRIGLRRC